MGKLKQKTDGEGAGMMEVVGVSLPEWRAEEEDLGWWQIENNQHGGPLKIAPN